MSRNADTVQAIGGWVGFVCNGPNVPNLYYYSFLTNGRLNLLKCTYCNLVFCNSTVTCDYDFSNQKMHQKFNKKNHVGKKHFMKRKQYAIVSLKRSDIIISKKDIS